MQAEITYATGALVILLTSAVARVALELFGPSLPGVRLFGALARGAAMVLAGLMARALRAGPCPLSSREREILAVCSGGLSTAEIASENGWL